MAICRHARDRPSQILTQHEPLTDAISTHKAFDTRQESWIKVELLPTH
jgi:threonine dehydrogenase-like Zn-dependent dehydrogenase